MPALADELGTTRSAAALELWGDRLAGAVVAIGNAPTALFRLLEMLDAGAPGRLRHRHAGRFRRRRGIEGGARARCARMPFLAVRGRLGGSAMTAAAINALARNERHEHAIESVGRLYRGRRRTRRPGTDDPEGRAAIKAPRRRYFAKAGRAGNARSIAAGHLRAGIEEWPLHYPMTTEVAKDCDRLS